MIQIKEKYTSGVIAKSEFIDQMYQQHQVLFDYCSLIQQVDIAAITISAEGVLFQSKKEGIKMFCTKNDKRTAPFEIMNFNDYEAEDAGLLYALIKDGDTIFDIGANIGWYSISMAKRFPATTVYSFEPSPTTFKDFENNVKINGIKNIVINNFGFSEKEETLTFFTSPHTSVSNSSKNITEDNMALAINCQVKKMDDFVTDSKVKIDIIKCDVEGAELFVYKGGLETIAANKPVIFTEMLRKWAAKFNYHPNDIIALLRPLGYACYHSSPQKKLRQITEVTNETIATNFFFLHTDKHSLMIKEYAE